MRPARAVYSALLYLLVPYALVRLALRSRREPDYARNVRERFGIYPPATTPSAAPLIWVHAVSVGETRAAEPLVRALQARYPQHRILLTHMTPTGRRTGAAQFGDGVERCYLPYDLPGAVSRFVAHFRPCIGIVLETEIWPNLIHACNARGLPLVLVNARLSDKSYRGYLRFKALTRPGFAGLVRVAAQAPEDARRLSALGARDVTVTGNIKFDVAVPAAQVTQGREWRAGFGARGVLLAASTREGEESLVLDAYERMAGSALLVIVPRHPQRFDEIAALLERRGLRYERRSAGRGAAPETQVLLGDSMGEMPAYYAACDVAFIGGSLLPYGGHNFIEACALGAPVLLGPHTYNFAQATEQALGVGAVCRVADASELARTAQALLQDADRRALMKASALEFSRAHQGATGRIMVLLEPLLAE